MNKTANILKVTAFAIIMLVCAILLWPFAVAGIAAYFLSGMRDNRWVSSGMAVVTAILWRLASGEWMLQIGGGATGDIFTESMHGILNWAFAAILVSAFSTFPAKFIEGYKSREKRTA